jgi:hypothetical protein
LRSSCSPGSLHPNARKSVTPGWAAEVALCDVGIVLSVRETGQDGNNARFDFSEMQPLNRIIRSSAYDGVLGLIGKTDDCPTMESG